MDFGLILLQKVVDRLLFVFTIIDSIGDVRSHDVSINRDEELSWVVGVVGLGQFEASGPQSKGIYMNNDESHGEGADEAVVSVFIARLSLDEE